MPASVRLYGLKAGTLEVARHGRLAFQYDADWLVHAGRDMCHHVLSLAMPFQANTFGHEQAGPFFDGLLPDNPQTRNCSTFVSVILRNAARLWPAGSRNGWRKHKSTGILGAALITAN
jgi:HipA-like protein